MYKVGQNVRVYLKDGYTHRDGEVIAVAQDGLYAYPVVVQHHGFAGIGDTCQFFNHYGKNENGHVYISEAPTVVHMNITDNRYGCHKWATPDEAALERALERRVADPEEFHFVGYLVGEHDTENDTISNIRYTVL